MHIDVNVSQGLEIYFQYFKKKGDYLVNAEKVKKKKKNLTDVAKSVSLYHNSLKPAGVASVSPDPKHNY